MRDKRHDTYISDAFKVVLLQGGIRQNAEWRQVGFDERNGCYQAGNAAVTILSE